MRDRRPVDELSIEELERVLAIKKREQRMQRLERMRSSGRLVETEVTAPAYSEPSVPVAQTTPQPAAAPRQEAPRPSARQQAAAPVDNTPRFEEDVFAEPRFDDPESAAKRKSVFNRALLGVEVFAVLGLLFIGINMVLSINALERETQAAQQAANESRLAGIPTIAPTSILSVRIEDYVLPGGHTVVADENGVLHSRFNFEEFIEDVPDHLKVAVQQQALRVNIVRPADTPETAQRIIIPRLNLDQGIVQGTDDDALRSGVGQVLNGAYPAADASNVVLAAHNDIYGELFRDLDTMQVGDEFQIQTNTRTFTYRVTATEIVDPTDVYVMANRGRATVTLISCYPYRVNNKRYIVYADRL